MSSATKAGRPSDPVCSIERCLGVLTDRLDHLVKAGVLTKRSYQEPGSRTRRSYHLTPAGRDLAVPLAALQQWGDLHDPPSTGPSVLRRSRSGSPVQVAFIDGDGAALPPDDVSFIAAGAVAS